MYDLILTKLKYVYNDDDNNIDLIKDFINNIKNSSNTTPYNPQKETDDTNKETDDPQKETDDTNKETDDPQKETDDTNKETDDPQKETDDPQKETDDPQKETDDPQKETDDTKKETDDTDMQTNTPTNTPVNPSDLLDDDPQKETNDTSDLMHDIIQADTQNETDILQTETDNSKIDKLNCLFKKINILFKILADLLKYNISKIDNDRYKNVNDEKIKFPKTIDSLILIIGCYGDAFSYDDQEELFNILELPSYSDLYTISEIPINMIPFVANNKIDLDALTNDYIIFSEKVLNFSCRILNINTDLEKNFIIENTIKNDD